MIVNYISGQLIALGAVIYLYLYTGGDGFDYYVIPCTLAAGLFAVDVVKFLRGQTHAFDPSIIIGAVIFMQVLPCAVLQIHWDFWPYLPPVADSLEWVSIWALLYLFGGVFYRVLVDVGSARGRATASLRGLGQIDEQKFIFVASCLLIISLFSQLLVYAQFGGVSGFINTFTDRQAAGVQEEDPFEGMGSIMILAESAKYVSAILLVVLWRKKQWKPSEARFGLLLLALVPVFLFFGGLRGSRSTTIFALFLSAGAYHFWIKRLSPRLIIIGVVFATMFVSVYYWYKVAGTTGLSAAVDTAAIDTLHESRRDQTQYLIVRDIGRMDMQALTMREISEKRGPDYALGRTYMTAIFSIVPKSLIGKKPDQITKEKTETLYGKGRYDPYSARQTTLVLGQFGEMFLNFSYAGPLLFFVVLGWFVRRHNAFAAHGEKSDVLLFLLPIGTLFCLLVIITDFNVIFQQLMRYLTVPMILLLLCRKQESKLLA